MASEEIRQYRAMMGKFYTDEIVGAQVCQQTEAIRISFIGHLPLNDCDGRTVKQLHADNLNVLSVQGVLSEDRRFVVRRALDEKLRSMFSPSLLRFRIASAKVGEMFAVQLQAFCDRDKEADVLDTVVKCFVDLAVDSWEVASGEKAQALLERGEKAEAA